MANDPKIDYDAASLMIQALADAFDSGGTLNFYDVGSGIPTNADDAITDQDLLCDITTPSPSFGTASNGSVSKSGTWSGAVDISGEPVFFRLVVGSYCGQGTVGLSSGTFDLEFVNVTWLVSGTVTIDTFAMALPRE